MSSRTTNTAWLEDGGEAGAIVRSIDWAKTPLGPIASWPPSLKTTVGTLLHSRHPMFLWWGPELIQFYNDGYLPSFGKGKHPAAMGQRGADCWQEIWPIISPQIDDVMHRGRASWNEDQLVPVWRNARIEEVYWTYGYSPVFDESGSVGGTLVVCTETTARVLSERRLRALRSLAGSTAAATTTDEVLTAGAALLEETITDVSFALIYSHSGRTGALTLARTVGLDDSTRDAIDAACRPSLEASQNQAPFDLEKNYGLRGIHAGPWPEPTTRAFVAAIDDGKSAQPSGFILFGLSPRLAFDDAYRAHLTQLAEQLGLATARIEANRAKDITATERNNLLIDAQQASRAKDEFFAMLGHELRNPLAPIVTALHLMKQQQGGTLRREQEIIERQVGHLVRLVDDLLDVSKIARGKITLRRDAVDLHDVVAHAIEIVSDLFDEHRHQISVDVPTGAIVAGDSVRLVQVVANLLTNAARYTEPDGNIWIHVEREGDDHVLSVRDNGMGIDAELLPRVFELFIQGRRNADRKEGGLGLGLALVRTLVDLHGGTVVAKSDGVGLGSEFEVRLPARGNKANRASRPPSKEVIARPVSKRILVVDDNVDSAEMMRAMLESIGHVVELAHDGPEALTVAGKFSPDVAVLDIGLPVMDGYELGRRLHATEPTTKCRLIALTGYGQEHDRAQSKASGFEEHLVKPVDMNHLLELIAAR